MKLRSGKRFSATARAGLMAGMAIAMIAGLSFATGAAAAPQPPAPPAPPVMERNVVVVERHGPDGESHATHVRTITRDGKTFVFETDKPLSDEDVERRIADAEARLPLVPPVPPIAGKDRHREQQRVIVLNEEGETVTDVVSEDGGHCAAGQMLSNVDTSAEDQGKVTRVRIRTCASAEGMEKRAMAEALEGVRKAREEISRDKSLSDAVRKEVLEELDAEISRMKRES